MADEAPERIEVPCAECGKPVHALWSSRGLLPGDHVLIADWLFHPICWDKVAAALPAARDAVIAALDKELERKL